MEKQQMEKMKKKRKKREPVKTATGTKNGKRVFSGQELS